MALIGVRTLCKCGLSPDTKVGHPSSFDVSRLRIAALKLVSSRATSSGTLTVYLINSVAGVYPHSTYKRYSLNTGNLVLSTNLDWV